MGIERQGKGITKGVWKFQVCGMSVGEKFMQYLRKGIKGLVIFNYWVNVKKRIPEDKIDHIGWKTQGVAMTSSGWYTRSWVSKLMFGWCATGKIVKVWKQRRVSS